ncbi:Alpha/Beta hydrolase protein [Ilyonectria sp. MPI-CAGE-AT-0026]|nr:Alpha/Beta hydrolase protein [Ilyonectria sp. MPI-CAGE-AT-0026]
MMLRGLITTLLVGLTIASPRAPKEFKYKQLTTSRNFTYNYIHLRPTDVTKPYILFLHGFPSSSYDWRHQIPYFHQKGYGIVAPDLLGYGGTSKPLDMNAYTGKGMAQDVHDILVHEKVETVIGVAHDWGSYLLSRVATNYPDLSTKLVFIDVGYFAPGNDFTEATIRAANAASQAEKGFTSFGYFLFFVEDEDATQLMDYNHDSVRSLFQSNNTAELKIYMGAEGGTRIWLEEGRIEPPKPWITAKDLEHDRELYSPENGGYGPALNWYKAPFYDINAADDAQIPTAQHNLTQPTLFIGSRNFISVSADFPGTMRRYIPDLSVINVETDHWVQLQAPDETNAILTNFIEG